MTPEHAALRCGCATASEFHSILAKGEGKTRATYLRRVVAEMLTEKPFETYSNGHMERGIEQEPFARMEYEARTGNLVEDGGFIRHPSRPIGCSPDGLIDSDGGGEFKSVIATVQVETILAGKYPTKHRAQVQGNLWLSKRKWWDFASYCADMKQEHLRLYVFRVERDEPYIEMLEKEVTAFIDEAERLRDQLLGLDRTEELLRASLIRAVA